MATEIPTPAELASIAEAAVRSALDPAGTGAVNLETGSRNDVMVSVTTALASRNAAHLADRIAARSIRTAKGDDLDLLAQDEYGDRRKQAAASTGFVFLERPSTATATVIPKGSRFSAPQTSSQPAVVFQANADFPVASGQGGVGVPIAVPVTCASIGRVGNVAQGLVTVITDSLPDTTWKPNTSFSTVGFGGGLDRETDEELRTRLGQFSTDVEKQRGTAAAILFGALRVPGVLYATVVEPQDGTDIVYVGDANYMLPAALASAVLTELEAWRTKGIPCIVRSYSTTVVTITANIYMPRPLLNYNVQALQQAATAKILAYFSSRPRPDEYYLDRIEAAAGAINQPEGVQSVTLAAPVANQLRPADTAYGGVTSLTRYVVNSSSVQITILPPQTS